MVLIWDKTAVSVLENILTARERTFDKASPSLWSCYLFFYIKDAIMEYWVPNGVTVNQHY